ncbi:MAG: hypothetical protein WAT93_15555 [Pontixanthobacter sp.]
MVGKKTRLGAIYPIAGRALLSGMALSLAAPGIAHSLTGSARAPSPDIAQCNRLPVPAADDELMTREASLELPADWKSFADVSFNWVGVKTKLDYTHCINVSWVDYADNFERLNDRFVGFDWSGYESGGYIMVDTEWTGFDLETGARPVFTADGSRFASINYSDSGFGAFEGFAIWDVLPAKLTPVHVVTNIPNLQDWRIDRWEDESCIHLSAIENDQMIDDWDNRGAIPRIHYVAGSPTGWILAAGSNCPRYDEG